VGGERGKDEKLGTTISTKRGRSCGLATMSASGIKSGMRTRRLEDIKRYQTRTETSGPKKKKKKKIKKKNPTRAKEFGQKDNYDEKET